MSNIKIIFGEHLRKLRKKSLLSQEELALKSGMHRTYIGMIERGEKNVALENIQRLAEALEIKINDLFNF